MHPDKIKELEDRIAELKSRWPAHSVPPKMWQQLEDLEGQLEKARKESDETTAPQVEYVKEIALAVRDQDETVKLFEDLFGLRFDESWEVPIDQMKVKSARIGQTQFHILGSTSPDGPAAKFVQERGEGLHHIAFKVADLDSLVTRLKTKGIRLVPDTPRLGRITPAGQSRFIFVHPKSAHGLMIELWELVPQKT